MRLRISEQKFACIRQGQLAAGLFEQLLFDLAFKFCAVARSRAAGEAAKPIGRLRKTAELHAR